MPLTSEQREERALDRGQMLTLTEVEAGETCFLLLADGTGFSLGNEYGVTPKVGDIVMLYGSLGQSIRGVDLNGEPVFYKTKAELDFEREQWKEGRRREQDEKFEAEREERDAAYDALPEVFRRRIAWFRTNNPRFRQELEPYEMSACVDAVKLAEWAKQQPDPGEAIKAFQDANYDGQKAMVPGLAYDQHSGNSFGFAVRLAYHYVTEPENVYHEHGAMVPLTGCVEYGCLHPRAEVGL